MRINVNDTPKIEAALKAANGRAKARTVTASQVLDLAVAAEEHLRKYAPKNALQGSRLKFREGVNCNSYKYAADATAVVLERGADDWFLTFAAREQTNTTRGSRESWMQPSKAAVEAARFDLENKMGWGDLGAGERSRLKQGMSGKE